MDGDGHLYRAIACVDAAVRVQVQVSGTDDDEHFDHAGACERAVDAVPDALGIGDIEVRLGTGAEAKSLIDFSNEYLSSIDDLHC